jgi:hypothetical protein
MTNKNKWIVILAMVLIFGMMVVDCGYGVDTALDGSWRSPKSRYGGFENDLCEYTFLAGNYEAFWDYGSEITPYHKGTYTTNDKGEISLKLTHIYDRRGRKWQTKGEFTKEFTEYAKSEGATDAEIKEYFEKKQLVDQSFTYFIRGNKLQLFQGNQTFTYNKQ